MTGRHGAAVALLAWPVPCSSHRQRLFARALLQLPNSVARCNVAGARLDVWLPRWPWHPSLFFIRQPFAPVCFGGGVVHHISFQIHPCVALPHCSAQMGGPCLLGDPRVVANLQCTLDEVDEAEGRI